MRDAVGVLVLASLCVAALSLPLAHGKHWRLATLAVALAYTILMVAALLINCLTPWSLP